VAVQQAAHVSLIGSLGSSASTSTVKKAVMLPNGLRPRARPASATVRTPKADSREWLAVRRGQPDLALRQGESSERIHQQQHIFP